MLNVASVSLGRRERGLRRSGALFGLQEINREPGLRPEFLDGGIEDSAGFVEQAPIGHQRSF